ncbi:MAG TPA: alpha/beta fold hydrolase [Thermoanaerobaculia bacterium]|nr:alpha/beta fold hydrolase [Thermoanaerobaculia bacterium]
MNGNARQRIRFLRTSDGVRLAWAEAGQGPVMVKAGNWLSHLEHEWESPLWRHWLRFFAERFRLIRHDERGCGMTDWEVPDLSFERRFADLEAVIEAAGLREPFSLLGISQGAAVAIAYAVRYPERVARIVIHGGYAHGWAMRQDPLVEREFRALCELLRLGWGRDHPAFVQAFTIRFVPEGSPEQIDWFNTFCRQSTSPEMAARMLESRGTVDVMDLLPRVQAPTLVLHCRNDSVTPLAEGRTLAAGIPDARFVELDSRNHILLEQEPAWARFQEAVAEFTGVGRSAAAEDPAFAALTAREREILALLAEGLANAQIAQRLSISDKTVRNHVSNLFDKLGVWTRAQAIVFARDHRFSPAPAGHSSRPGAP